MKFKFSTAMHSMLA